MTEPAGGAAPPAGLSPSPPAAPSAVATAAPPLSLSPAPPLGLGGLAGLLGLVALGLAFRVVPLYERLHEPGGWRLVGPDAHYHARRIHLAWRHWPRVPDFDAWLEWPHGAHGIWAPLYDFVPATIARATGLDPLDVAVFFPAGIGALTVVPLVLLLLRASGPVAAWVAGAVWCVLPAATAYSSLGNVDHHNAETLFAVWGLLAGLALTESCLAPDGAAKARWRWTAGLAGIAAAATLVFAGSVLFLCLPAALGAIATAASGDARARARLARCFALAFVVAAVAVAPWAAANHARGRPLSPNYLSLLQPALLAVLGLAPAVVAVLRGARTATQAALRIGALAVGALAVAIAVPGLVDGLRSGLLFVRRAQSPWLATIGEFQPLLAILDHTALAAWVGYLGYGLAAAVPLLIAAVVRSRARTPALVAVALGAAHGAALVFMQMRFIVYAAPWVAAVGGWLVAAGATRHRLAGVAAAAALVGALSPTVVYWRDGVATQMVANRDALAGFLEAMRDATPPAGDPFALDVSPAYGVLAPWDHGHEVLWIAKRPVVACNFGEHLAGGGYEAQRLFYEELGDAEAAERLLVERRCRYVLTQLRGGAGPGSRAWPDILSWRLHVFDGSDALGSAGSGRLRLVLESEPSIAVQPGPNSPVAYYKLFEVVAGAVLVVGGQPGERGVARLGGGSAQRRFLYERAVDVGGDGAGRVRVAYQGPYRIDMPGRGLLARVRAVDVEEGNEVRALEVGADGGGGSGGGGGGGGG